MVGQQMITEARIKRSGTGRIAVLQVPFSHRHESVVMHTFFLSILRPLSDFIDRIRHIH